MGLAMAPLTCAVGGRARAGRMGSGEAMLPEPGTPASTDPLEPFSELSVGTYCGEMRRRGAPGQPQSERWLPGSPSGVE